MTCMQCQRRMEHCICEDADARLETLLKSPYLDSNWIRRVQAERFLNRYEIQQQREQQQ